MAKLLTKKYKNNNSESSAYNKTYGRFVYTETISTDEFAAHISSHGSPFDRATVMGVLASACDCLLEMTLDSKRVRLGDLGTFYMSAESEGVESEEDFGSSNIKKVHLRFLPNMKHSYALDSVSNRRKASFVDIANLMESGKSKVKEEEEDTDQSQTPENPNTPSDGNGETPSGGNTDTPSGGNGDTPGGNGGDDYDDGVIS